MSNEFELSQLNCHQEIALPCVISLLEKATKPISNLEISREIHRTKLFSLPSIRHLINHIRVNHLVKNVLANSKGYYISDNEDEIAEYIKSLQGRINAIEQVKNSFK